MKYLFLMYGAESQWTDDERKDCMVESLKICDELTAKGQFLATSPLQPVSTAATVRVRDGKALITDGPFAETTEQLGGYFLLDLPDLDAAIAVATRFPSAAKGTVEIRPLLPLQGAPVTRPFPVGSKVPGLTPFLLLVYGCGPSNPHTQSVAMAEASGLCRQMSDQGYYLNASPLHPPETATCVRLRDGNRIITDGPFAETHEVLGGFYLILAESRDAALEVAARQPGAQHGALEVRPLHDFSALNNSVSIS